MKTLGILSGLLIIGLLSQCGLAENKRKQRQAYLPPRGNNAVISEEYITIREQKANNPGNFQESSFGDSKYEIFEVHSHYEPPTNFNNGQQQSDQIDGIDLAAVSPSAPAVPASFPASYQQSTVSSAPNEEVIRVQHIHVNVNHGQQSNFKAADYLPPLGGDDVASQQEFNAPGYLPPGDVHSHQHHHEHHHEHHQEHHQHQHGGGFSAPDYLPPHQNQHTSGHSTQFSGSNNFLSHQSVNHAQSQQHGGHQSISQAEQFRGPDYLPPHHNGQIGTQHGQSQFNEPDYLPPRQEAPIGNQGSQYRGPPHHEGQVNNQQGQYKGPDNLPSNHETQIGSHQGPQGQFKGPDYLPPHQEVQINNQGGQFRGPDFSPPHHEGLIGNQQGQYKGPDYLPPHHNAQIGPQQGSQGQYKGPDYLPPHSETHHHHQHSHQHQFKGPDYLPPHHEEHHTSHQQGGEQFIQSTQIKGPDYLPPHGSGNSRQPGALPGGYDFLNPEPAAAPHQPLQASQQLPPGYDFVKPENAEQAIAELHSLPNEQQQEVVVQSQIQVAHDDQDGQIIYGQRQSGHNYQANGYLPPPSNYQAQQGNAQTVATATAGQQFQGTLQQVGPQTFGPAPVVETGAQPPTSSYSPLARPVQADQFSTNLHSLSSYMTTVQPNERYGDAQFTAPRQPFREYGPPPNSGAFGGANSVQQQQPQRQLSVAPMYREQASRSPYYAPAMSYASNAVANSFTATATTAATHQHHQQHSQSIGFREQTRHNLQQLMPADIHHFHNAPATVSAPVAAPRPALLPAPAAVPIHQSPTGTIRTVQIVNPTAVKTLKVLETSDHAGVKTIKILGQSDTHPTGEHRVIKVVTQHGPNAHEQTVKIFNDHDQAATNAYLPPRVRVVRQSPLKLQMVSNLKHRPFTGRRRYRA